MLTELLAGVIEVFLAARLQEVLASSYRRNLLLQRLDAIAGLRQLTAQAVDFCILCSQCTIDVLTNSPFHSSGQVIVTSSEALQL